MCVCIGQGTMLKFWESSLSDLDLDSVSLSNMDATQKLLD